MPLKLAAVVSRSRPEDPDVKRGIHKVKTVRQMRLID